MKQRFGKTVGVLLAAFAVLSGIFIPMAVADEATTCKSGFGVKTPVLLVHGWNGDLSSMAQMEEVIKRLDGVVTDNFNYTLVHDQWVTNSAIGPALARRIDCLAQASLVGGGSGKVIVVAHSMGGLAARFAANQTIGGRKVANELGLVITLGTPHLGSSWGNTGTAIATSVCRGVVGNLTFNPILGLLMNKDTCLANFAIKGLSKDSSELRELPRFPAKVPVKAIAGHAGVLVPMLFGEIGVDTRSDLVVGVDSATDEYTNKGVGDGKIVYECEGSATLDLPCSHVDLPNASYVQGTVKASIEKNVSSYAPKPKQPSAPPVFQFTQKLTANGLQIPAPKEWELHGRSATDETTCGSREYEDYWKLCAWFSVDSDSDDRKSVWDRLCADKLLATTKGMIGDKQATVYKYGRCDAYESPGVAYLWRVSGRVTIEHRLSYKGRSVKYLDEALAAAVWK